MITTENIKELSFSDKCSLMEQLWESMTPHEDQVTVRKWHQNLLDERERLLQQGKAHFVDWTLAKKQIRKAIA